MRFILGTESINLTVNKPEVKEEEFKNLDSEITTYKITTMELMSGLESSMIQLDVLYKKLNILGLEAEDIVDVNESKVSKFKRKVIDGFKSVWRFINKIIYTAGRAINKFLDVFINKVSIGFKKASIKLQNGESINIRYISNEEKNVLNAINTRYEDINKAMIGTKSEQVLIGDRGAVINKQYSYFIKTLVTTDNLIASNVLKNKYKQDSIYNILRQLTKVNESGLYVFKVKGDEFYQLIKDVSLPSITFESADYKLNNSTEKLYKVIKAEDIKSSDDITSLITTNVGFTAEDLVPVSKVCKTVMDNLSDNSNEIIKTLDTFYKTANDNEEYSNVSNNSLNHGLDMMKITVKMSRIFTLFILGAFNGINDFIKILSDDITKFETVTTEAK